MIIENNTKTIKQAGNNGQISLGKKYTGKFIPDNEMWLYRDNNNEVLDKAIKWVEKNKRQTSSLRGSYEVTDEAISGNIPEIATLYLSSLAMTTWCPRNNDVKVILI